MELSACLTVTCLDINTVVLLGYSALRAWHIHNGAPADISKSCPEKLEPPSIEEPVSLRKHGQISPPCPGADRLARTARSSVELAIVPSNTVQVMFDAVMAASPIPVISIVDMAAEHCRVHGYRQVGIPVSTATPELRLYDGPLSQPGVIPNYFMPEEQATLRSIICQDLHQWSTLRNLLPDANNVIYG